MVVEHTKSAKKVDMKTIEIQQKTIHDLYAKLVMVRNLIK